MLRSSVRWRNLGLSASRSIIENHRRGLCSPISLVDDGESNRCFEGLGKTNLLGKTEMNSSECISPAWAPGQSQPTPTVFVIDDDFSVRESLALMIRVAGWKPETFASAQEFLQLPRMLVPSCLILNVTLPDINGLDLQRLLADRVEMPIIFITDNWDVSMTVRAVKAGAIEFLTKPLSDDVLLNAIRQAFERSDAALRHEMRVRALKDRYASLSPRERQVMALVVDGRLNKQVSDELGIALDTAKAHRGKMMRKMQAGSVADLVRIAATLNLAPLAIG